ncbi:hypothetical protein [Mucilaginibacter sp. UR6-11]|uniref:hypothetical protein n=1 Tax=Mucilaginibacter sp. UR6-11 TaxID=1435644 RepID=UPI001E401A22|nr:hypothetical protein [Mucilaginibacter sp. UR6-11]MCC8427223.1 hypothetical protein [Mucilaginibacter sp. UR6-11]
MKTLKVETFFWSSFPHNALVEFVNENKIRQEDILKIVLMDGGGYTLFYYSETI